MSKFMKYFFILLSAILLSSNAFAGTYNLDISRENVNITGKPVSSITINHSIPGPTLKFKEGEDVTINVTNHMNEETSIHWHGLLIDPDMDGVPGLNGFKGIKPGATFAYHFKIRQSGTYWYHSHSGAQEQAGNYGSIVITPKGKDPIKSDRDYVILLSDFTKENENSILKNLKMSSSYYSYAQRTVGDFFGDVKTVGFKAAWKNAKDWGKMRMAPTDLSDVSGYKFLVNGKTPEQNWTGIFKPGEKIRLRFINASAMSFYDIRIPGLKMTVVAADGQNVEPLPIDEFRFGIAETYDVIVQPKDDKPYIIVSEPIDRTGFALATLATHEGLRGEIPTQRPRATLTMFDMNMDSMMKDDPSMDMSNMSMESGWAKTGIPEGEKELSYSDLRYLGTQKDTRAPEREIVVTLGGNMERYIWTMNGKTYDGMSPINLKYGERVRLKFINETMMAHPMHLHGMFVQLENGQPAGKLPNKHTVIIPPGQSYSVLLTANEPGEWAFHCHLLYHMMSGMMNKVVVAKLDAKDMPADSQPATGGHSHAH
jgi:FtsP/CotA-like multicopper oxidase with cupredoxin domain